MNDSPSSDAVDVPVEAAAHTDTPAGNGHDDADMQDEGEARQFDSTVKEESDDAAVAGVKCGSSLGDADETIATRNKLADAASEDTRPWDFSNRKVMVQGVLKFHDVKTVTKMVKKWLEDINAKTDAPLAFDKIKKPPKGTWMLITMQTEVMLQPFIDYINSNDIRNKRGEKFVAKLAVDDSGDKDNLGKRSSRDNDNDDQPLKRQRKAMDGAELQNARRPITEEEIKDKITPLWKLSPAEQLDTKMKEMIKKCAMKIVQEIKAKFR
jgi:hypothetical protein